MIDLDELQRVIARPRAAPVIGVTTRFLEEVARELRASRAAIALADRCSTIAIVCDKILQSGAPA